MQQQRILVVDDDPYCRVLLQAILEDYGHIGGMAEDGQEALTKLAQADYDAVLLDYNLPGDNGLTVLHHIQRHYPSIPVVMITGNRSDELATQVLAAGARACLFKPIDVIKFKQALKCWVG